MTDVARSTHQAECGHPGRSCFGGLDTQGWHLVFSRSLTDEEWGALVPDDFWDEKIQDFTPERTLAGVQVVAPDVTGEIERAGVVLGGFLHPPSVAMIGEDWPVLTAYLLGEVLRVAEAEGVEPVGVLKLDWVSTTFGPPATTVIWELTP